MCGNGVNVVEHVRLYVIGLLSTSCALSNSSIAEMHLYLSLFLPTFTHACTLHIEVADKFCDGYIHKPRKLKRGTWSKALCTLIGFSLS